MQDSTPATAVADISYMDLFCPSMAADPFTVYAKWRKTPVHQLWSGLWLISDYDNTKLALKNFDIFSSVGINTIARPPWMSDEHDYFREYPLIFDDPPKHTHYRRLLRKNLLDEWIDKQVVFMRKTALSLITEIKKKNNAIEFVEEFAQPFIGLVVNKILGLEDNDYIAELHRWIRLVERPPEVPNREYTDKLEAANRKQANYFKTFMQSRRGQQNTGLVAHLLAGNIEGRALTDEEMSDLLELMLFAGYQAPMLFLCLVVMQLAYRPEVLTQLIQYPDKIPLFIEEALRFNSSQHLAFRKTQCPVTLSGVTIPQGVSVIVNIASANRDPAKFPNPDTFDIERENIREHIAFGYGLHNCLGATLARMLAKITIEALLNNFNEIVCPDVKELSWFYSMVAHGVSDLPVTFKHNKSQPKMTDAAIIRCYQRDFDRNSPPK